jgi:high-affinity iron transporter
MFPATLVTFREILEASFIVATILGLLVKVDDKRSVKTLILATISAVFASIILLGLGTLTGNEIREHLQGRSEEIFEGTMMITTAFFITWAVFVLHKFFARYKTNVLSKVRESIDKNYQWPLFILVFTAVFREGLEIVLFLSTLFFAEKPGAIVTGFISGSLLASLFAIAIYTTTIKLPIKRTLNLTSLLLIIFAAGLLMKGVGALQEAGFISLNTPIISLPMIPDADTIAGSILKTIFGLTPSINLLQSAFYTTYLLLMVWWIFLKDRVRFQEQKV